MPEAASRGRTVEEESIHGPRADCEGFLRPGRASRRSGTR
jgi:hypothetical protein